MAMPEQRPEIQEELSNPLDSKQETGVLGSTTRSLGRTRLFLKNHPRIQKTAATLGIAGGLVWGVAMAATGCGAEQSTTTDEPTRPTGIEQTTTTKDIPGSSTTIGEGISSTVPTTEQTTTSTTGENTSTTEDQTTTTKTEVKIPEDPIRSFESLFSEEKNLEDVKTTPEFFGNEVDWALLTDPINVSEKLQTAFRMEFPGESLTYSDPDNRSVNPDEIEGNLLNASLSTLRGYHKNIDYFPFFGAMETIVDPDIHRTFLRRFAMKFVDLVGIPGSKDFFAHGVDPLNPDTHFYVRIVREKGGQFPVTQLTCFDLSDPNGLDFGDGPDSELAKNMENHLASRLSDEDLAKFFIPGDFMGVIVPVDSKGLPIYDFHGEGHDIWGPVDLISGGKPIAGLIGDFRYAGADRIKALFKEQVTQQTSQVEYIDQLKEGIGTVTRDFETGDFQFTAALKKSSISR